MSRKNRDSKAYERMDERDYKLFLELDKKYDFLLNKKWVKTDGFLVAEVVSKDLDITAAYLPKTVVHPMRVLVTDKPEGWDKIHPTGKFVKE